jgi:hypothetical protein
MAAPPTAAALSPVSCPTVQASFPSRLTPAVRPAVRTEVRNPDFAPDGFPSKLEPSTSEPTRSENTPVFTRKRPAPIPAGAILFNRLDSCTLFSGEAPVGTWLSLVEHSLGVRGVGSSNLPVPTIWQPGFYPPLSHPVAYSATLAREMPPVAEGVSTAPPASWLRSHFP